MVATDDNYPLQEHVFFGKGNKTCNDQQQQHMHIQPIKLLQCVKPVCRALVVFCELS